MSHLSRMKNPDLPYLSVAAALRAYVLRPASLDISATLGTTASLTRTCGPCLIDCRISLLPVSWPSPIYYLLFNHCYVRYAPPRAIKGKGDLSIYYHNTKRAGYSILGIFCA